MTKDSNDMMTLIIMKLHYQKMVRNILEDEEDGKKKTSQY